MLNPNFTWDIICENPDMWTSIWCHVNYLRHPFSGNPNIDWEFIETHYEIGYDYAYLSENPMSKHPYFHKQLSYILK
jgi:hypothetical protein